MFCVNSQITYPVLALLRMEIERFNVLLVDKYNKEGRSLFLDHEERLQAIHSSIRENMWSQGDLATLWYNPTSVQRVRLYMESILVREIDRSVELITWVAWKKLREGDENAHFILLPKAWWIKALKHNVEKREVPILIRGYYDTGNKYLRLLVRGANWAIKEVVKKISRAGIMLR